MTLDLRAKDRRHVPDPNKAGNLEKLRERSLLKEFEEYVAPASSRRKLKIFRLEAVWAGFKKAWQERNYTTIITMSRKIPIPAKDAKHTDRFIRLFVDFFFFPVRFGGVKLNITGERV